MSIEKEKFSIWTTIGRLSTIVSITWILFQAFKNFVIPELKTYTTANYYYYSLDPKSQKIIKDYNLYQAALKFKPNPTTNDIEKLKKQYSSFSYLNLDSNFNTIWVFSIKNEGTKIIEELFLEMPNSGLYRFSSSEGLAKNESFKNRISLGNLKPTHSLSIVVWTEELSSSKDDYHLENFEEKIRFTHKEGAIPIKIPIEDNYFWAWIVKNDYFPFVILIIFVISCGIFIFYLGYKYGPKLEEMDMKTKLKELKELEEWKQKNESTIKNLENNETNDSNIQT